MSTQRLVLVEDHHWGHMLPLAASVPICEMRVGMFSLRERLELLADLVPTLFLERSLFKGMARRWNNDEKWCAAPDGQRDLWLSERIGPNWEVLKFLLENDPSRPQFLWKDEAGLISANLESDFSEKMFLDFSKWQSGNSPNFEIPASGNVKWEPFQSFTAWQEFSGPNGQTLFVEIQANSPSTDKFVGKWLKLLSQKFLVINWIWELVPATEFALPYDLKQVVGRSWQRLPSGLVAKPDVEPNWNNSTRLLPRSQTDLQAGWPGVQLQDPEGLGGLFCGSGVEVEPGVFFDTTGGPVILDQGVHVMSGCRLEGPLYCGPGCIIKSGARIYGGSSFGIGCRIAGEIGETVAMDFVNKQHDGFIGHAVLGSWVNLGALTTCSDLKNNYGNVRVDLGWGSLDTGSRFVGLMAGDHVKTAIGTMFNTGTSIGFAANIFGPTMPPKYVGNFSWGGQVGAPIYETEKALATARIVMDRRGCVLTPEYAAMFRAVASNT